MAAAAFFDTVWLVGLALVPWAIGKAIDEGIIEGKQDRLWFWAAVILLLAIEQASIQAMRDRAGVNNWNQAAFRSVQLLGHHVSRTGQSMTSKLSTGEVAATVNSDAFGLANIYFMTSGLISSIVAYVVVAIIVLSTSVSLGLFVLLGVPAFSALLFLIVRPLRERQAEQRQAMGRMTALGADTVAGLRVLRGIGGEDIFVDNYKAKSTETRLAGNRVAGSLALMESVKVLVAGVLIVGLTWLAAVLALDGRIQPGELVSFYGYAGFLVMPIGLASSAISTFIRSLIGAKKVLAVLAVEPAVVDGTLAAPIGPSALVDSWSGVRIEPGTVTAVVSHDTAVSAAIADRFARFDDAELEARPVLWAGLAVNRMPLLDVRARITLSDSQPEFFAGSLRESLDPHSRHEDLAIHSALATASATDILDELPDGLDSAVTERGRTFSGGQRQRLGVARALLSATEVLVLVEPTSAVDSHSEARIGARLATARSNPSTATLLVTTSPLLLGQVDSVYLVENGVVSASGTHHELLETNEAYRAAVVRWDF